MSADVDVAVGFLKRWTETTALGNAVPGGLHQKPLRRPKEDENPLATPYAEFEVGPDPARKNEYTTGNDFIDYRRVKVTLHGGESKEDLGEVLSTVAQAFRSTSEDAKALEFPTGTTHMRTELVPSSDTIKVSGSGPVAGEDRQETVVEFCCWSHRVQP